MTHKKNGNSGFGGKTVKLRCTASFDVTSIDFSYPNGHSVFRAFELHARAGEFVAVLGPSGCGKSTLLNLLSGFLSPTRGQVSINGIPVRPEMPELGYVFQTPQLFPWLNVLENVRFGLRMQGNLAPTEQYKQALSYLELVGMEHVAERLPYQLSGGMQQRIAIARSLAMEPSLLLMDEPFAALDAISRKSMNDELLYLWTTLGQTILFVTHDIDEAVLMADRVVMLGLTPQGIDSELVIELPRPRRHIETGRLPKFAEYRNILLQRIGNVMQKAVSVSTPLGV
ncbi:ABC transporter ATP-binding protein [Candidatus Methylospira mobilis]|uniref:ABC transporter ATP-binding protein n=1 Tax=Candidatus Methylospira mobilis TaxID=1808979 RepID=A0A5Q0BQQ2_9GAMM|nr:ABC transporter ATP-binding protein [Candidatus Methylospira mobilis]QFY44524.1 ABC transporter ATP-binding protein [Candidatus Methylospira mobilis]